MATLDELNAARAVLVQARTSGALVVQFSDGSRVQYRSDAELVAQVVAIDRQIAATQSGPARTRFYFQTSKGL